MTAVGFGHERQGACPREVRGGRPGALPARAARVPDPWRTAIRHRLPWELRSRPRPPVQALPRALRRAGPHPRPPLSPLSRPRRSPPGSPLPRSPRAAPSPRLRSRWQATAPAQRPFLRRAAGRSPPSVAAPTAVPRRPEVPRRVPCPRLACPSSLRTRGPGLRGPGGRALFSRCPGPFLPAAGPRRAPGAHARLPDVRCPATSCLCSARSGGPRLRVGLRRTTRLRGGGGARGLSARGGSGPAGLGRHRPWRRLPRRPALRAGGPAAVVAVPGAGARRAFRGAAVLEAVLPAAPAVRARVAAAGLAAAFGAPARPLPAVPGPPVLAAAVGAAAPRRFGATLVLLLPFAGASAVRALPAGGFAVTLPRAGAPAWDFAPLPVPGAARLAGLFLSSVGVLAIGSPRLFADVAPDHPRLLPERSQACEQPLQDRVARAP